MNDSYLILGVAKNADKKTIRTAYRTLAKLHHPDQNSGNEEKFHQIKLAYEALTTNRHIENRNPRPPRNRKVNDNNNSTNKEISVTLTIELSDLVKGATRRLTLPNGQELEVCIPKGHNPDHKLQLKKQGKNDCNIVIELLLRPDPSIDLQGRNLIMYLEIPLWEMRKGGSHNIVLFGQELQLTIPPLSSPGKTLLIKGKGLAKNANFPAGDLLLTLTAKPNADMKIILEQFSRAFIHSAELRQQHLRSGARSALTTR
ncbi:MAG: DnaJ domain-containing protein [Robiginitomaculum sp.]|nr:DnaJ domain-containing protein [Robiginitomaculum sp.]